MKLQFDLPVILASQSPRRRELLGRIVPEFAVCPADADETLSRNRTPKENVRMLAQRKARAAAAEHPNAVIVAADTIVVCEDVILGKPTDADDARRMLHMLSGRTHQVMTAVCVKTPAEELAEVSVTDVTFRPMAEAELEAYVTGGEPMDKAGAYGIQGDGGLFISGIHGDYYGVMGLPICMLYTLLLQLGGGADTNGKEG